MSTKKAPELAYEILGEILQSVVVRLEPGQSIVGNAGSMLFMEAGVTMETGLTTHTRDPGMVGSVVEAAKRKLAGDVFLVTRFTNESTKRAEVAFSAPSPGEVLPLALDDFPEGIIVQRAAFLCGSRDIDFEMLLQRRILAGFFSGEGFILQRISSSTAGATFFAHGCGTMLTRQLAEGDALRVDAGCIIAYEPSVTFDVELVPGLRNMVLGGHGPFLTTLSGPGRIWLQTMPLSRLASRIWEAAPQSATAAAAAASATAAATATAKTVAESVAASTSAGQRTK